MWHITGPVRTRDYHTAGEPFRIVTDGVPEVAGSTVAERRILAFESAELQAIRQFLCHEPRGHADMYGCFIVPPDDDGADLGVLFWHKDGYSTACGHGTIALGVWAVQSGLVTGNPDGVTPVTIDVPSGRVVARVHSTAGSITHVVFENVESYVIERGIRLDTSRGTVSVDLSYGGAIYASVSAASVGLTVQPDDYGDLIAIGREIKWALNDSSLAKHATDDRLSGVYGTILFDDLGDTADGVHQRNVTVFADGEVDRSPCGSGTGARLAILADEGRLREGQTLTHDSIVDTRFLGRFRPGTTPGTIIPEVEGMAYATGDHTFTLDQTDPVGTGFVLR
ncbi:MAG TPA: proline racemase family protein [Terrimesophilobacter sp.]|nr:proline racemase family protein [Terrimesophilobacter sp.]